jgi:hypothetical protein
MTSKGILFRAIACAALTAFALVLPAFAAESEGAKPDAAKPAAKPAPPLAYITVAGASGDGEQALAAALGKRLSVSGVKTASALDTTVYSVEGIVKMTAAKGGRQAVRVDWTVFGPDGTTLGGVSQTKLVRKGSLDRKWGAAADAAARAAATPIAKLILLSPRASPKAP